MPWASEKARPSASGARRMARVMHAAGVGNTTWDAVAVLDAGDLRPQCPPEREHERRRSTLRRMLAALLPLALMSCDGAAQRAGAEPPPPVEVGVVTLQPENV